MPSLGSHLRTTPPPRTPVFLLRRRPLLGAFSILNPFYLGNLRSHPLATLELTGGTVRCTLVNEYGYAGWLAKRLGVPDLKERLKTEEVIVFEFPRNGYEIAWPKLDRGMLFRIGESGGAPWLVSFSLPPDEWVPNNFDWEMIVAFIAQLSEIRNTLQDRQLRAIRRQWRTVLESDVDVASDGGAA